MFPPYIKNVQKYVSVFIEILNKTHGDLWISSSREIKISILHLWWLYLMSRSPSMLHFSILSFPSPLHSPENLFQRIPSPQSRIRGAEACRERVNPFHWQMSFLQQINTNCFHPLWLPHEIVMKMMVLSQAQNPLVYYFESWWMIIKS